MYLFFCLKNFHEMVFQIPLELQTEMKNFFKSILKEQRSIRNFLRDLTYGDYIRYSLICEYEIQEDPPYFLQMEIARDLIKAFTSDSNLLKKIEKNFYSNIHSQMYGEFGDYLDNFTKATLHETFHEVICEQYKCKIDFFVDEINYLLSSSESENEDEDEEKEKEKDGKMTIDEFLALAIIDGVEEEFKEKKEESVGCTLFILRGHTLSGVVSALKKYLYFSEDEEKSKNKKQIEFTYEKSIFDVSNENVFSFTFHKI